MDLSKIPKAVMWGAISFVVVIFSFFAVSYIQYNLFGPESKYIATKCSNSETSLYIYLTAKQDLRNITILDGDKVVCRVESLQKDSEDFCKIEPLPNDTIYPLKIKYVTPENKTMKSVIECKIKSPSLLEKLLS